MLHKIIKIFFIIAVASYYLTCLQVSAVQAEEIIYGEYCYTYGDRESFIEAKQLTRTLAIRNAIESYRSYVNATTEVKNFTLTNDIVQMISSGYMKNISVVSHSENGREICEKVQATVTPKAIEEAIKREVQKRTETIEERGIDNNGTIKILNIRQDVKNDYSKEKVIAVTIKALKNYHAAKDIDLFRIFIAYYDKDGNAIGGDEKLANLMVVDDEIKTKIFDNIPNGTNSYKVWLKKQRQTEQKTKSMKVIFKKRNNQK